MLLDPSRAMRLPKGAEVFFFQCPSGICPGGVTASGEQGFSWWARQPFHGEGPAYAATREHLEQLFGGRLEGNYMAVPKDVPCEYSALGVVDDSGRRFLAYEQGTEFERAVGRFAKNCGSTVGKARLSSAYALPALDVALTLEYYEPGTRYVGHNLLPVQSLPTEMLLHADRPLPPFFQTGFIYSLYSYSAHAVGLGAATVEGGVLAGGNALFAAGCLGPVAGVAAGVAAIDLAIVGAAKVDLKRRLIAQQLQGDWYFLNNRWVWGGHSYWPSKPPPQLPFSALITGVKPEQYFEKHYGGDPVELLLRGRIPYGAYRYLLKQ